MNPFLNEERLPLVFAAASQITGDGLSLQASGKLGELVANRRYFLATEPAPKEQDVALAMESFRGFESELLDTEEYIFDQNSAAISGVFARLFKKVRTEIVPQYLKINADVKEFFKDYSGVSALRQVSLPFNDAQASYYLSEFANVTPRDDGETLSFALDGEKVKELFETGRFFAYDSFAEYYDVVGRLIGSTDRDVILKFINAAYQDGFGTALARKEQATPLRQTDYHGRLARALVKLQFIEAIIRTYPLRDNESAAIRNYRLTVGKLAHDYYRRALRLDEFILGASLEKGNTVVYVNRDLEKEYFVNKGGVIEAILGAAERIVLGQSAPTKLGELLANQDALVRAYRLAETKQRASVGFERNKAIRNYFQKLIDAHQEEATIFASWSLSDEDITEHNLPSFTARFLGRLYGSKLINDVLVTLVEMTREQTSENIREVALEALVRVLAIWTAESIGATRWDAQA